MSLEHKHSILDALMAVLDEERALQLIEFRNSKPKTKKTFDTYRAAKTAKSIGASADRIAKFWELVKTAENRASPSIEYVRAVFRYDPETGYIFRRSTGLRCEGKHKQGYLVVSVAGKLYLSHRVAWFIVHGVWPEEQIDHIDRNRKNNRLSNLRAVNNQQNCWNAVRGHNSTGFIGVHKSRKRWAATIRLNGKTRYLGRFDTPQAASEAYQAAAARRASV